MTGLMEGSVLRRRQRSRGSGLPCCRPGTATVFVNGDELATQNRFTGSKSARPAGRDPLVKFRLIRGQSPQTLLCPRVERGTQDCRSGGRFDFVFPAIRFDVELEQHVDQHLPQGFQCGDTRLFLAAVAKLVSLLNREVVTEDHFFQQGSHRLPYKIGFVLLQLVVLLLLLLLLLVVLLQELLLVELVELVVIVGLVVLLFAFVLVRLLVLFLVI